MITAAQTGRLVTWAIVVLIVLAVLLHFFGPARLEWNELIVIALLIVALMGLRVGLRRSE
jgi:purine-cytosine permease-like protein